MSIDPKQWADPWWRLNNLYRIVTEDGQELPFKPNPEQAQFWREKWYRNLILKARRLGMSTFVDLMFLDQCIFNPNRSAVVIAHTVDAATKLFRNVVRNAYNELPGAIRQAFPLAKQTESELVFANGSSISVTTSARSGNTNLLHVSEAGKLARQYPEKMREIVTGSFPTVPQDGFIVVESTAEGKDGWFYQSVRDAMKTKDEGRKLAKLEFKLHFFPWWRKAEYRSDPDVVTIDDDSKAYFATLLQEHGITLDPAQKAWYVLTARTLQDSMGREHPSYEDEAFAHSTDGIVFAKQMRILRQQGRIGKVPLRPELPVNTFWDIGKRDLNVIWLHQRFGSEDRFLKVFAGSGSDKDLTYWWNRLEDWRTVNKAKWGSHYLPHDGNHARQGRVIETPAEVLESLGARSVEVVPRIQQKSMAIELARRALIDYSFDAEGCAEGIEALDAYQYIWDEHLGMWSREPLHNPASNFADALMQHAQWFAQDQPRGPKVVVPQRRYAGGMYGG